MIHFGNIFADDNIAGPIFGEDYETQLLNAVKPLQYRREFGRGVAWFGKDVNYIYTGRSHYSNQWPDWLAPIVNHFGYDLDWSRLGLSNDWNHCLVNHYAPHERLGWHQDDEDCIEGSLLSISLGGTGEFSYTTNRKAFGNTMCLSHGDYIIADGDWWRTNHHMAKNWSEDRYNLTFRRVKE